MGSSEDEDDDKDEVEDSKADALDVPTPAAVIADSLNQTHAWGSVQVRHGRQTSSFYVDQDTGAFSLQPPKDLSPEEAAKVPMASATDDVDEEEKELEAEAPAQSALAVLLKEEHDLTKVKKKPGEMNVKKVKAVLFELEDGEENYLKSLQTLRYLFLSRLISRADRFPELGDARLVMLSHNVDEIFVLSGSFLEALRVISLKDVEAEAESVMKKLLATAEVMESFAMLFRLYGMYAQNYGMATEIIKNLAKTNEKFKEVLASIESDKEAASQPLASYLVKPIQRIPMYIVLMNELINRTPAHLPAHTHLCKAREQIQEVGEFINGCIRDRENREKLLILEKLFLGETKLLAPRRFYVRDAKLMRLTRRGKKKLFQFFLFNDMLIYALQKSRGFKEKKRIELRSVTVKDGFGDFVSATHSKSLQFCFTVLSETKSFVVSCFSAEEKEQWFKDIDHYANALRSNLGTEDFSVLKHYQLLGDQLSLSFSGSMDFVEETREASRSKSHTPEASDRKEFRTSMEEPAPIWAPDQDDCSLCGSRFNLVTRRHHCRKCGRVVCSACSPHRVLIPTISSKYVRCCNRCHEEFLQKQFRSSSPDFGSLSSPSAKLISHRHSSIGRLTGVGTVDDEEIIFLQNLLQCEKVFLEELHKHLEIFVLPPLSSYVSKSIVQKKIGTKERPQFPAGAAALLSDVLQCSYVHRYFFKALSGLVSAAEVRSDKSLSDFGQKVALIFSRVATFSGLFESLYQSILNHEDSFRSSSQLINWVTQTERKAQRRINIVFRLPLLRFREWLIDWPHIEHLHYRIRDSRIALWKKFKDMTACLKKVENPEHALKNIERWYAHPVDLITDRKDTRRVTNEGYVTVKVTLSPKVSHSGVSLPPQRYFFQMVGDLLLLSDPTAVPQGYRLLHFVNLDDCSVDTGRPGSKLEDSQISLSIRTAPEDHKLEFLLNSEEELMEWFASLLNRGSAPGVGSTPGKKKSIKRMFSASSAKVSDSSDSEHSSQHTKLFIGSRPEELLKDSSSRTLALQEASKKSKRLASKDSGGSEVSADVSRESSTFGGIGVRVSVFEEDFKTMSTQVLQEEMEEVDEEEPDDPVAEERKSRSRKKTEVKVRDRKSTAPQIVDIHVEMPAPKLTTSASKGTAGPTRTTGAFTPLLKPKAIESPASPSTGALVKTLKAPPRISRIPTMSVPSPLPRDSAVHSAPVPLRTVVPTAEGGPKLKPYLSGDKSFPTSAVPTLLHAAAAKAKATTLAVPSSTGTTAGSSSSPAESAAKIKEKTEAEWIRLAAEKSKRWASGMVEVKQHSRNASSDVAKESDGTTETDTDKVLWEEYTTDSGLPYWFNTETKETTFIDPFRTWTRCLDKSGKEFWYNKSTQESTYVKPEDFEG